MAKYRNVRLALLASAVFLLVLLYITASVRGRHCNDCASRLKLLSVALQHYCQEDGKLPPAYVADKAGKPMHSWRVLLLPCIEGSHLFDEYDMSEPWDGPQNRRFSSVSFWEYQCPCNDGAQSRTNYVAVVGKDTFWPGSARGVLPADGSARGKVLLIAMAQSDIRWAEPCDITLEELLDLVKSESTNRLTGRPGNPIMGVDPYGEIVLIDPHEDPEKIRARFLVERTKEGETKMEKQRPVNNQAGH